MFGAVVRRCVRPACKGMALVQGLKAVSRPELLIRGFSGAVEPPAAKVSFCPPSTLSFLAHQAYALLCVPNPSSLRIICTPRRKRRRRGRATTPRVSRPPICW